MESGIKFIRRSPSGGNTNYGLRTGSALTVAYALQMIDLHVHTYVYIQFVSHCKLSENLKVKREVKTLSAMTVQYLPPSETI